MIIILQAAEKIKEGSLIYIDENGKMRTAATPKTSWYFRQWLKKLWKTFKKEWGKFWDDDLPSGTL